MKSLRKKCAKNVQKMCKKCAHIILKKLIPEQSAKDGIVTFSFGEKEFFWP